MRLRLCIHAACIINNAVLELVAQLQLLLLEPC